MSVHVKPNEEVLQKLAAEKRKSTILSLLIGVLSCVLMGVVLSVMLMKIEEKNVEDLMAWKAKQQNVTPPERPEMNSQVKAKPTPPAGNRSKVITVANRQSPVFVMKVNEVTDEPFTTIGMDDYGDGMMGGDGLEIGIPPRQIAKRCSKADRLARLQKSGGSADCEDAVMNALRWMQKNQNKNGSWCKQKQVGMTGLALLSYLGHCETPLSVEFGESVENAIIYLTQVSMKNDGKLASDLNDKHWPYEHAIATYALAEAYTLCKAYNLTIPNLKEAVSKGADIIVSHQHTSGGWDYSYDMSGSRGGDTSITCWHLQALKACKTADLSTKASARSVKNALKYLKECQLKNGTVGYQGHRILAYGPTMTSGAVLCWQQWGQGRRSDSRKALRYLKDEKPLQYNVNGDLYKHYYQSQAMINEGGKIWADYNSAFRKEIVSNQNKDGSWKSPATKQSRQFMGNAGIAPHYRTCLCTLMLEVYYRYLPSSE